MDAFLLIASIVILAMILIGSFYFVIYFQDEDDKLSAWLPKITVILGIAFCCITILLLPLDVANQKDETIPMGLLWQIVSTVDFVLLFIMIPFCFFYYEGDPESPRAQLAHALRLVIVMNIIVMAFVGVLYFTTGYADIPIQKMLSACSINVLPSSGNFGPICDASDCSSNEETFELRVTFIVYFIAIVSFLGSFFFIVFGGIGLAALPIDLINSFRRRTFVMSRRDYMRWLNTFRDRSARLIHVVRLYQQEIEELNRKKKRSFTQNLSKRKTFTRLKNALILLEKDYELVTQTFDRSGQNPLVFFLKLIIGVVGSAISILWFVHMGLFVFSNPPVDQFLNGYFVTLDEYFPFLGTATYTLFAFYLLWAVIKGTVKFGFRFFFFIEIHPMTLGGTMMNSLLFNTELLLLSTFAVVNFLVKSFSVYARNTSVEVLFAQQINHLRWMSYFWIYYQYAFVALAVLTALFLIIFPGKNKDTIAGKAGEMDGIPTSSE